MKRFTRILVAAVVGCFLAIGNLEAQNGPIQVDLELSLLVDVSGSVDGTEFNLQRNGYVSAFNSSALWNTIENGQFGRIAVNFIYWSSANQQQEAVGWTLIDSQVAAQQFAAAIGSAARPYSGTTYIGAALEFATDRFANNGFDGTRWVIDVSGDGTGSGSSSAGRDYAVSNGVDAINGIVIGASQGSSVYNHYVQQVITPNGFVEVAETFDDFEAAISRKLIREIQDPTVVPEPISMALLGTGLAGVAAVRRRRSSVQSDEE